MIDLYFLAESYIQSAVSHLEPWRICSVYKLRMLFICARKRLVNLVAYWWPGLCPEKVYFLMISYDLRSKNSEVVQFSGFFLRADR